jgi:glucokinase
MGLSRLTLINDFGAMGHAVATLPPSDFRSLAGPDRDLPTNATISVIGPGTGLGVAHVWRDGRPARDGGNFHVQSTEGGHIDFAPIDAIDDAILARLRARHGRVSVERVAAGPAIVDIYETLALLEHRAIVPGDAATIWHRADAGDDPLAAAAAERFCLLLGSVAGDLALAQGAGAVVLSGGVAQRQAARLAASGFHGRFIAKGRFRGLMESLPIKLVTHPHPGLLGAAAAFLKEHPQ